MNLSFTLLVIDDAPDSIEQAIETLRDHLNIRGFKLDPRIVQDLSKQSLRHLGQEAGKNYDLVMVDFRLGQEDMDGAEATLQLRNRLPYTEIVFYSSDPEANLLRVLAEHSIEGVFVARRDDLADALIGLAGTVIRKAVDLNHMRGIAMAEVSEMDVLMEETLLCVFRHINDQCIEAARIRTIDKVREHRQKDSELLVTIYEDSGLPGVIGNSRLFSSAHKYQTVRRLAKCLLERPSNALRVLNSYENDIIHTRNMLAHVKEDSNEDGEVILRSIKSNEDLIIDDDWMSNFRQKLQKHKSALTTVCKALDEHLGAAQDSEEYET